MGVPAAVRRALPVLASFTQTFPDGTLVTVIAEPLARLADSGMISEDLTDHGDRLHPRSISMLWSARLQGPGTCVEAIEVGCFYVCAVAGITSYRGRSNPVPRPTAAAMSPQDGRPEAMARSREWHEPQAVIRGFLGCAAKSGMAGRLTRDQRSRRSVN